MSRHWPFLTILAKCESTHTLEWATVASGFLVLRYFDHWVAEGPVVEGDERAALLEVWRQIHAIPERGREVRCLLDTALDVLCRVDRTQLTAAVGPLLAYGLYLEQNSLQGLAHHVVRVVTDVLEASGSVADVRSVAGALLQRGRTAHHVGDLADAEVVYRRAAGLAEQLGDYSLGLRVRIYQGMLCNTRGNLPCAEATLDAVIAESRTRHLRAHEARALWVRGCVRQRRGQPAVAIRDFWRAYALTVNRSGQEVLLNAIAECMQELGFSKVSWKMHQNLARTARNVMSQAIARANLLEIAVAQGDLRAYQTFWTELRAQYWNALPIELALYAEFSAAKGVERFLGCRRAIAAYNAVAEHAHSLGTYQLEFLARGRMEALMEHGRVES